MRIDFLDKLDKQMALNNFKFEKAAMMLDMLNTNHEMMYQEAAVVTYVSDRGYDDLCALYEAADNETSEKKKGVIGTLIDAVASIFSSIGDAISSFFAKMKGEKVPDKVTVPKGTSNDLKMIEEAKNIFAGKEGEGKAGILKFFGLAGAAGAAAAAAYKCGLFKRFMNDKTENTTETNSEGGSETITGSQATDGINNINILRKAFGKIASIFKKDSESSSEGDQSSEKDTIKLFNIFKKVGNFLTSKMKELMSALTSKVKGKGNTETNNQQTPEQKSTEDTPKEETDEDGKSK